MKVWRVRGFLKNYQCIREEERKKEREKRKQSWAEAIEHLGHLGF
jgi:hypothetical protein